jgi:malto-oligosyltrehalose trehalohydrolase
MTTDTQTDALELGAHFDGRTTRFRVWAPDAERIAVVHASGETLTELDRAPRGYFVGASDAAPPGTLYRFLVDEQGPWPDPCSRYQPEGVHGPSMVVDTRFQWTDSAWRGISLKGHTIYELHIGTFTPAGTFDAACERLSYLRDLGITLIEVMPVAQCPGRFNWGYDGVQLFAPSCSYGDYAAFKRFVDRAHALGLGVILDVVYNHLGPDGNYVPCFTQHFFSRRHRTDWGETLNFDAAHAEGVRAFVIENACYWVREFHLDGLRLDATQSIFDDSERHILAELVMRARQAALPRSIVITAENEPQCSEHLLPPERGGFGIDGMWNDDFHHAASVALCGSRDGYLRDFSGRAQELVSCAKHGFLFQGQRYGWQDKPRGSPFGELPVWRCIAFLDNHDQAANRFTGCRIAAQAAPPQYRALAAVLLLGPQTPLVFMGQEFAATSPFTFFADHRAELNELVHRGRRDFLAQFRAYADPAVQALVPDPAAHSTFESAKLDWREADSHAAALALHRDLLRLRQSDPVLADSDSYLLDGATLTEHAFVLRWYTPAGDDRLLVVNLAAEARFDALAEPLVAPPRKRLWSVLWASEDARYGGHGIVAPVEQSGRGPWYLAAHSATFLQAIQEHAS